MTRMQLNSLNSERIWLQEQDPEGIPNKISTQRATNNLGRSSFAPRVAGIWNCLTENVVSAPSVNSF